MVTQEATPLEQGWTSKHFFWFWEALLPIRVLGTILGKYRGKHIFTYRKTLRYRSIHIVIKQFLTIPIEWTIGLAKERNKNAKGLLYNSNKGNGSFRKFHEVVNAPIRSNCF